MNMNFNNYKLLEQDVLFYDELTDMYFITTPANLIDCLVNIYWKVQMFGDVYVSDFYHELGIMVPEYSEYYRWAINDVI